MHWHIFCKVIDNHGDLGVSWRLANDLAGRGHGVELWVDEPSALGWMTPMGLNPVRLHSWYGSEPAKVQFHTCPDVLIEMFGCDVPDGHLLQIKQRLGQSAFPVWMNLEYLSAEDYVERCHTLPSPVLHGIAEGETKRFFYPGFTEKTGGLIREKSLLDLQGAFDASAWRRQLGRDRTQNAVSLFCYEPPGLNQLPQFLSGLKTPTHVVVTAGRAQKAFMKLMATPNSNRPELTWQNLPFISQVEFDHLLWACDLNFVRGEDSLVRALWAGKPFIWNIYPQDDGAHEAKLEAFLQWLDAPASLRQAHRAWNGIGNESLPEPDIGLWAECVQGAKQRLLSQQDLSTQLFSAAQHWAQVKKDPWGVKMKST